MSILANHKLFSTSDADFARDEVSKIFCNHDLKVVDKQINAAHYRVDLSDDISLNYQFYGAEVEVTPKEPHDFFMIQLPIRGNSEIISPEQNFISSHTHSSIISPTESASMRWSADCEQLMIQIKREAVEKRLSLLTSCIIKDKLEFKPLMQNETPKTAAWWRLINYLVEEFKHDHPLTETGDSVYLEKTLIDRLLYAQPHNFTELLLSKNFSIAPAHVKKAEEYIREHISQNISVEDLVAATGVSARSLHDGFKKFKGQSTISFLRSVRMEGARADLLSRNGDNVTDIATKWGFSQLGRFSVNYKSIYGESPSDTINRT